MAKRFTDTDLWQKEWFLRLPDLQRSLFLYIKDNCDCAGVYEANYMLLSFIFRKEITKEDILAINESKTQIEFLNTNKFFLIDFCSFQYGELKPTCKPHLKVIEILKKHSLFERVSKGYLKGIETLEEKEKDKDKEKEKEKEQVKEKKEIPLENFDFVSKPIDPFCNSQIDECIEIYKATCTELCKLTGFERRDLKTRTKISEFLSAIGCDMDYYRRLCVEANRLKYIANSLIDISSMVNNHIGIMNGKYVKKTTENEVQNKIVSDYEKLLEL